MGYKISKRELSGTYYVVGGGNLSREEAQKEAKKLNARIKEQTKRADTQSARNIAELSERTGYTAGNIAGTIGQQAQQQQATEMLQQANFERQVAQRQAEAEARKQEAKQREIKQANYNNLLKAIKEQQERANQLKAQGVNAEVKLIKKKDVMPKLVTEQQQISLDPNSVPSVKDVQSIKEKLDYYSQFDDEDIVSIALNVQDVPEGKSIIRTDRGLELAQQTLPTEFDEGRETLVSKAVRTSKELETSERRFLETGEVETPIGMFDIIEPVRQVAKPFGVEVPKDVLLKQYENLRAQSENIEVLKPKGSSAVEQVLFGVGGASQDVLLLSSETLATPQRLFDIAKVTAQEPILSATGGTIGASKQLETNIQYAIDRPLAFATEIAVDIATGSLIDATGTKIKSVDFKLSKNISDSAKRLGVDVNDAFSFVKPKKNIGYGTTNTLYRDLVVKPTLTDVIGSEFSKIVKNTDLVKISKNIDGDTLITAYNPKTKSTKMITSWSDNPDVKRIRVIDEKGKVNFYRNGVLEKVRPDDIDFINSVRKEVEKSENKITLQTGKQIQTTETDLGGNLKLTVKEINRGKLNKKYEYFPEKKELIITDPNKKRITYVKKPIVSFENGNYEFNIRGAQSETEALTTAGNLGFFGSTQDNDLKIILKEKEFKLKKSREQTVSDLVSFENQGSRQRTIKIQKQKPETISDLVSFESQSQKPKLILKQQQIPKLSSLTLAGIGLLNPTRQVTKQVQKQEPKLKPIFALTQERSSLFDVTTVQTQKQVQKQKQESKQKLKILPMTSLLGISGLAVASTQIPRQVTPDRPIFESIFKSDKGGRGKTKKSKPTSRGVFSFGYDDSGDVTDEPTLSLLGIIGSNGKTKGKKKVLKQDRTGFGIRELVSL